METLFTYESVNKQGERVRVLVEKNLDGRAPQFIENQELANEAGCPNPVPEINVKTQIFRDGDWQNYHDEILEFIK